MCDEQDVADLVPCVVNLESERSCEFANICAAIGDAEVVMIGEATHGTEEFYAIRAELTKTLIEKHGFSTVLLEADFPPIQKINRFVHGTNPTGIGRLSEHEDLTVDDAMSLLEDRFPRWMWMNEVTREFLVWLRGRNDRVDPRAGLRCRVLGLDTYSTFRSMDEVAAPRFKFPPRTLFLSQPRIPAGTFRPIDNEHQSSTAF